jgi:ribonucleoside-diphosphate reductase alpha chain
VERHLVTLLVKLGVVASLASILVRSNAVQRMLLRLGIASTIYPERRSAGHSLLPDGRGGTRLYPTRAQHELVIANQNSNNIIHRSVILEPVDRNAIERGACYAISLAPG